MENSIPINIKSLKIVKGLFRKPWHHKLIALYLWMLGQFGNEKIIITCAWEKRKGKSPHNVDPLRAIDIRSWIFGDAKKIEYFINKSWLYDPDRPWLTCAVYHDTGRGPHIHLQVHDNTVFLDEP